MARLQDAQGRKEFLLEESLSATMTGQGAQGLQQRVLAEGLPEIALHPPDRHHRGRVDAKALLHLAQGGRVPFEQQLAFGDTLFVDQARQVVPDGQAELGLVVQLFDHAHVGREIARQAGVGVGADARGARRCLQSVEAGIERSICLRGQGQAQEGQSGRQGAKDGHVHEHQTAQVLPCSGTIACQPSLSSML